MVGETLNTPRPTTHPGNTSRLPRRMLYSISARIGGYGLDTDAFETLRASARAGFLGKAIAYDNRQNEIAPKLIHSLRWHPVRLLSNLGSVHYYGAKKKYLDWITAQHLARGKYDLFHSWSGDCLQSLRVARQRGIPSLLEIPTWHRDAVPVQREPPPAGTWKDRFLLGSERYRTEYQLADLIVVLSQTAAETFLRRGFPEAKLFYLPRGVDIQRFRPGTRPNVFRAIFTGALIERKGIHHLLQSWQALNLPKAELWLAGNVHAEAKPHLQRFAAANVRVIGFTPRPEEYLQQSTVHVFPSRWEGSAKTTYEAAACGLPQIITRESGDVVRDGIEGIIVPPGDVGAIAAAIRRLYEDPDLVERMSVAARQRVVENFTWDHFRERLLIAYAKAMQLSENSSSSSTSTS